MGFRAPYLLGSARMLLAGTVNLERLRTLNCADARTELLRLPTTQPTTSQPVGADQGARPSTQPSDTGKKETER